MVADALAPCITRCSAAMILTMYNRAETIRPDHDRIRCTIWCTRYDMFRDTFAILLAGKQRLVIPACDQKHSTPPITTACAVMMCNGYNNGGLLIVSRCSVFVMNLLVLLEYTGCYLWYLMFVSNQGCTKLKSAWGLNFRTNFRPDFHTILCCLVRPKMFILFWVIYIYI